MEQIQKFLRRWICLYSYIYTGVIAKFASGYGSAGTHSLPQMVRINFFFILYYIIYIRDRIHIQIGVAITKYTCEVQGES